MWATIHATKASLLRWFVSANLHSLWYCLEQDGFGLYERSWRRCQDGRLPGESPMIQLEYDVVARLINKARQDADEGEWLMFIYLITRTCYCEGFISHQFAQTEDEIKRIIQNHVSEWSDERASNIRVDMDEHTVKWDDECGDTQTYHLHRFHS